VGNTISELGLQGYNILYAKTKIIMMNFVRVVQFYSIKTVAKINQVSSIGTLSLGNLLNSHLLLQLPPDRMGVSRVIE